MNNRSLHLMAAVLVLGATASMRAHAGCENALKVVGREKASTIATFDAEGNKLGDVPKAQLINLRSLACDETRGLVKVMPADGHEVWVKRGETKRAEDIADTSPNCNRDPVANDPSHVLGATNGIDPGCTPAKR